MCSRLLNARQGAARMSYKSLCKTAEYFEDRARRARQPDNHERLAAVAKKYRLRAEIQRKLENAVQHERGLEDRASLALSPDSL